MHDRSNEVFQAFQRWEAAGIKSDYEGTRAQGSAAAVKESNRVTAL